VKTVKKVALLIIILLLCSLPLYAEDTTGPIIDEVIPPKAKVDEKVTIKGSNFHKEKKKNIVRFGTINADVLEASPDTLVVTVPKGAKVGGLSVEVMGHRSKEVRFYVLPYLEFQLTEKNMTPGQKTKGVIRVLGSRKPWKIRVINKYYEVIDLPGGNDQVVVSSGGEDNKVELDIMAKQMGNFSLICKKIEELDESPVAVKTHELPVTPTPTPEPTRTTPAETPTSTRTTAVKPAETPAPEPTRTTAIKLPKTPMPTRTAATKPAETATPEPTKTAAIKPAETATPEPTKTAAIKPAETTTPEPTPERTAAMSPEPSPLKVTPKTPSSPSGKSAVLAYCAKLKDKIGSLKTQSQKLQAQLEDKIEALGRQRGIEDAKKQSKLASIDDRGKKIAKRIAEIPRDRDELKKDPDKNKTKIDNLAQEEIKLRAEQKNIRAWKKKLATDYSKQVSSLQKTIKALSDKRDGLQKEIRKLQDEYDSKLKSLISAM
jgi:hypothetical protein